MTLSSACAAHQLLTQPCTGHALHVRFGMQISCCLTCPGSQGMTAQPHPSKGKETRRARGERLLRTAMGHFGLTDLETFWDRQLDTKALLGWNAQTVVLAFRGTASMRNACSDMKVWRMAHEPIRGAFWLGTRPMVHTGAGPGCAWQPGTPAPPASAPAVGAQTLAPLAAQHAVGPVIMLVWDDFPEALCCLPMR